MIKFPDHLGCFIVDGNKTELKLKHRYLGDIHHKVDADVIDANFRIDNDKNMDEFTKWWLRDLDFGTKEFALDFRYLGKMRKLMVVMDNSLVATVESDGAWKVPMKLNVKYLIGV
jgi:hypothetical protein